jgi:uncharacterized protein
MPAAELLELVMDVPRRMLVALVRGYRLLLKPWLGNACRFEPTCSQYTLDALQRHGAAGGTVLAAARLLRCHPWCEGGCDPVPENFPNPAHGLFKARVRRPTEDVPRKTETP